MRVPVVTSPAVSAVSTASTGTPSVRAAGHSSPGSPVGSALAIVSSRRVPGASVDSRSRYSRSMRPGTDPVAGAANPPAAGSSRSANGLPRASATSRSRTCPSRVARPRAVSRALAVELPERDPQRGAVPVGDPVEVVQHRRAEVVQRGERRPGLELRPGGVDHREPVCAARAWASSELLPMPASPRRTRMPPRPAASRSEIRPISARRPMRSPDVAATVRIPPKGTRSRASPGRGRALDDRELRHTDTSMIVSGWEAMNINKRL
ncbi:hypothetical protein Voc01_073860 [Virgisporangium ochraceum]|uniref:Uncharacterized protein n=1 Tax=Virgisporangium ochraceum TaxID=65505 RepID=A0A8J3ZY61_9ACTN|nr:hypothetical protein Voc01_073860 [Virgisporangium ochraceum]